MAKATPYADHGAIEGLPLLLDGDIPVTCHVLVDGDACLILDPGYEKERIRHFVAHHGLKVEGIVLTHGHIDHLCAADCFPVPVYLHAAEVPVFLDSALNGLDHFGAAWPYPPESLRLSPVEHDSIIRLGTSAIRVVHTPGHTVGSICLHTGTCLYTGDTLFAGTVGRWDFPTGDLLTLETSIRKICTDFPPETVIIPSHGPRSTLYTEVQRNPFVEAILW